MSFIKRRLTYANVMATLAVFGVLAGGTAIAGKGGGKPDVTIRTATSAAVGDTDGAQNGNVGPVANANATAKCKKGESLVGGGASFGGDEAGENVYLSESYPKGKTWKARGIVDSGAQGEKTLVAYAICLN